MSWPPLPHNEFFSGGLLLGVLAAAAAILRGWLRAGLHWARRRFVAEVELRDFDAVLWFGFWFANTSYGSRCRNLEAKVLYRGGNEDTPELNLEPGIGPHLLMHRGRPVLVVRGREEKAQIGGGLSHPPTYWHVTAPGRVFLRQLLAEASEYGMKQLSNRNCAYASDPHGSWERVPLGSQRSISTVVLPNGVADSILEDVRKFVHGKEWYTERGIPWRRGYLLYGPPGTGKTSLVRAICNELGMPLYTVDLTAKDYSDSYLRAALSRVPANSVVLLEDLDEQLCSENKSNITLGGVLNALDGPLASEGRVLFATTNNRERLGAKLLRPGRIDVELELGMAVHEQLVQMFLRFHPGELAMAEEFAAAIPPGIVSPAAVQAHLLTYSDEPVFTVQRAMVALLMQSEERRTA